MKNQGDKVAASVTVYRVGDMTTRGRKAVCGWLRKLADDLQNEPEAFAKTFRARYLYPANALGERCAVAHTLHPIKAIGGDMKPRTSRQCARCGTKWAKTKEDSHV
jgi:hypothetical protein